MHSKSAISAAVLGAVQLLAAPASANILVNGSFESATGVAANSTLEVGATNLSGWTVVGSGNLIWCNSGIYCERPAFNGTYSLDLTGLTNVIPYAGVTQTVPTNIGATYELTFGLAGRSDSLPVIASAAAGSLVVNFSNSTSSWETKTMSFVADAAFTPITLRGVSAGGSGLIIQIDAVNLVAAPVPEPAAWLLLLAGSALLTQVTQSRRRSKTQAALPMYRAAA